MLGNILLYEPQHMGVAHDGMMYIGCIVVVHNMTRPNHPIVSAVSVNPIHKFDGAFSIANMHTISQL